MRALGSLLLVLAQLRPALGIVLCAVAGPTTPAVGEECREPHMTEAQSPVPSGHPTWSEAGTPSGTGCGLTDLCTPVPQGPAATALTPALSAPSTGVPVLVAALAPRTDLSAPPTPPPNL